MKRTRVGVLALGAALLAAPASAHADFAPELRVALDPPHASSTSALTATVTHPAQDTAIQRFTLNLPAGFTGVGAPGATACPLASVFAFSCPASSRIGGVEAVVGSTIAFSGPIHKTSAGHFAVFLSGLGGAISQVVSGSMSGRSDSSIDLKLDQLPALGLSRLSIHLHGGSRALFRTPPQCGYHTIDGKFTSRQGDLALARTIVEITGCAGAPTVRVSNVRLGKKRFHARGFKTVVRWTASQAAERTTLHFTRRRGKRWRNAGKLVGMAREGENLLRWDGTLRGRKLRRGAYRLRIQPQGSSRSAPVRFRVR